MNYLDIEFKPGDIQLIHNHVILHDRTDYEDWPELERRRHLLRLWLCQNGRPLPADFADRHGSSAIGNRGGIVLRGVQMVACGSASFSISSALAFSFVVSSDIR